MKMLDKMMHIKKIESKYFNMQLDKSKQFEIRKNDCDYQVGDLMMLYEIEYDEIMMDNYETRRFIIVEITCIIDYEQKDGYVVLGTKELCRYTGE